MPFIILEVEDTSEFPVAKCVFATTNKGKYVDKYVVPCHSHF